MYRKKIKAIVNSSSILKRSIGVNCLYNVNIALCQYLCCFWGVTESVKKWKDKMQDPIERNVHVVLSCFSGCQFQGVNNGGNVETVTRVP